MLRNGAYVAVTTLNDGAESELSTPYIYSAHDWNNVVLDVDFDNTELSDGAYYTKYAWPADVDGDGEMEYVVDRLSTDFANRSHKLQAYDRTGQCLWTIDMGPNIDICSGQSDMVTVGDIDCDGRAEVLVKSSDGTRFWDAANATWGLYARGSAVADSDGDGVVDYRPSTTQNPPFYVSVVDGQTGAEKAWAELDYSAVTDGDDQYGRNNRADYHNDGDGTEYAFMAGHFCMAYEDGIHPTLMMECCDRRHSSGHHYYYFAFGYDWTDGQPGQFRHQWTFARDSHTPYVAQFHQVRVADVDGDGVDEMIPGGGAVNMRQGIVSSAEIGHGDRFRVSDIDPERPGMEVYAIQQSALLGQLLYDAATGERLHEWYLGAVADVGRGECMDVDTTHLGYEIYSTMDGLYDCEGNLISSGETDWPYEGIWWDGALDREVLGSHGGSGWYTNVMINKYGGSRLLQMSKESNYVVHSGTGNRPLFMGDILGDWREEVVLAKNSDTASTGFCVYSTNVPTSHVFYCLLQDPHYAGDCTTRGYYQSPNTSFYLGAGMPQPPLPPVMQAGPGLLLYDLTTDNSAPLSLGTDVTPDTTIFMLPRNHDLTFSGSATIAGHGDVWKSGQGKVSLPAGLKTTGTTVVSEGEMQVNGSIAGPVDLRARGTLSGNAILCETLTLEGALNYEGGRLRPGGDDIGVITLRKGLAVNRRLFLEIDIQSEETPTACDLLQVEGDLSVTAPLVFSIHAPSDGMQPGWYPLVSYAGAFSGSLSNISTRGLSGLSYEIVDSVQTLWLKVNAQRAAADEVVWTGAKDTNWDYQTRNFSLGGEATEFVANDTLRFDDSAVQSFVNLAELMPTGGVTVDNSSLAYEFSGEGGLSGAGGFTKLGTASLTLGTSKSDYTGVTRLLGGTVSVPSLSNGGAASSLGAASAQSDNWLLGPVTLRVTGSNVASDRGVTLLDTVTWFTNGSLTLQGSIVGKGRIVKRGTGQLTLTNTSNTYTGGTELASGTLAMGAWNTSFGTPTSEVVAKGGTVVIFDCNSTSTVPDFRHALVVPEGATVTLSGGSRCKVSGSLSGAGTLKVTFPYVRGDYQQDVSQFGGLLEAASGQFRLTADLNLRNATFQPDADVYVASVKSQSGTETSRTHHLGALQGTVSTASFGTGTWNVGYLGTDTKFAGTFASSATFNKVGEGMLSLTGASSAKMTVSGGLLSLDCTTAPTTSALVTVASGGTVCGTGQAAGIVVNKNGTLRAGKPTSIATGILTLTGNLTVADGALIVVRGRGISRHDKFVVNGKVSLVNPQFRMERLSGEWSAGDELQVFECAGGIQLSGTPTFEPAVPIAGYLWDASRLASDGIIAVSPDPTAIQQIKADADDAELLDVSGRRVAHPDRHGIFIQNGQKTVR